MKEDKYIILKKIDDQRRFFGLPIDEVVPLVGIIGFCFWFGSLLTGIVLGFVAWMSIRHFKKGQGSSWLINLLYWYLPSFIFKGVLIKTPPSEYRHWIG